MGFGGASPKVGRKAGRLLTKTQLLAQQALREGRTPIQVMLDNMRWWDGHAQKLTEDLKELSATLKSKVIQVDGATGEVIGESGPSAEDIRELRRLLEKSLECRVQAQQCAVDAAPYCHPKIQPFELPSEEPERTTPQLPKQLTMKEAADLYARAIRPEPV